MMMRAGVSYNDWRQMTRWQRDDYMARTLLDYRKFADELQKADGPGETISVVLSKVMGMF